MNTSMFKTACCAASLPSNATAQQPPLNVAIDSATPAHQPPTKPSSLLDLARNRLRNNLATSTQKDTQQTQETAIRQWLTSIEEFDPAIIAEVLDACRNDPEAMAYYTRRANGNAE